jgi:hypothetical protein
MALSPPTLAAQVGVRLLKSKKKDNITLGKALCEELVEVWRAAEQERKQLEEAANLMAARREAALEAGRSRSLRQRKPVRLTHLFVLSHSARSCCASHLVIWSGCHAHSLHWNIVISLATLSVLCKHSSHRKCRLTTRSHKTLIGPSSTRCVQRSTLWSLAVAGTAAAHSSAPAVRSPQPHPRRSLHSSLNPPPPTEKVPPLMSREQQMGLCLGQMARVLISLHRSRMAA